MFQKKLQLFVNKLAQAYIQDYIENKFKAANVTVDFLEETRLQGANNKLVNSEKNIQDYRDDKNIINIRQETETDLRKICATQDSTNKYKNESRCYKRLK